MSLEAWGDEGDADSGYTQDRVDELIAEAVEPWKEALVACVAVLKQWHNMNFPERLYPEDTWKIYYENAPEMKLIREALS